MSSGPLRLFRPSGSVLKNEAGFSLSAVAVCASFLLAACSSSEPAPPAGGMSPEEASVVSSVCAVGPEADALRDVTLAKSSKARMRAVSSLAKTLRTSADDASPLLDGAGSPAAADVASSLKSYELYVLAYQSDPESSGVSLGDLVSADNAARQACISALAQAPTEGEEAPAEGEEAPAEGEQAPAEG